MTPLCAVCSVPGRFSHSSSDIASTGSGLEIAFVLYDVFRGESCPRGGICDGCFDLVEQFDCFQQNLNLVRKKIVARKTIGVKEATEDTPDLGNCLEDYDDDDDDEDVESDDSGDAAVGPSSRKKPKLHVEPKKEFDGNGDQQVKKEEVEEGGEDEDEDRFRVLPAARDQNEVAILDVLKNSEKYMKPVHEPEVTDADLIRDLAAFRDVVPASVTSYEEGVEWDAARASSFSVNCSVEGENYCFRCEIDLGMLQNKLRHHVTYHIVDKSRRAFVCGLCQAANTEPHRAAQHLKSHSQVYTNYTDYQVRYEYGQI